ncbi:MAG: hybrid sensor histidine kinase/response regulator [Bacteroidetes bacterium CG12_big_fil_rev_8_21_14_0_65_60_17]|nr:MAG: hybrid sensor histidine kinase/response regulator [Bacteroidetes bacterium CG12_big_fil_rev_8_21_14_0_65_60_17]
MKRALIVDDKTDHAYLLKVLMEGNGYEVDTAQHGAEALVKARANTPDLIVSDLLMPVMDGFTLLRRCKLDEHLRSIPFVVYTATYTDENDRRLALDLGADAFILKPAEPDAFMASVKKVIEQAISDGGQRPSPELLQEGNSLFKLYSETLIRKLEEKSQQLQEANKALRDDLEARKQMEASLLESEERFRQLAENIEEVFWISDPEKGVMHYVSPAYETIWGRTCQSLYENSLGWIDAVHEDDRDRLARAAREDQASGDYDEIYRIVRPDGDIRWVHDRAFPVTDDRGNVYRIVGTAIDVTEQVEAERRIAEQAALLDKAHDAIMVLDLEYRVLYWNKSAALLYGRSREEAMGRSICDVMDVDEEAFQSAFQATVEEGEWSGEFEHGAHTGDRVTVDGRWTLVHDSWGEPASILAIHSDVTERRKLEKQYLRAQRMESIGTLAGGIAHDLNNLLAPIVMGVDLLRAVVDNPKMVPVIENIGKSAERGTSLVRQVLSFARGVDGSRMPVLLTHIVREVEGMAKTSFPKNIEFVRRSDPDLWTTLGDPTHLNQVLMNICVNARDAMPQGGRITITTRNVELDEQYVVMNPDLMAGRHVVVEVADEGKGMSRETMDRVFEPFFTTKEVGEGTGLGLPTSLGIIKSHGGTITLYSEVGKGSVFKVYLPAMEGPVGVRDSGADVEEGAFPRGNNELILVVDDEASILTMTRQTLETFGYRVLTAEDGAQAVGMYADHRDDIALIVTDMMMPVMDGSALIKALRRMDPDVPFVAASGIHGNHEVLENGNAGVQAFLEKPYSAAQLLTTIAEVLARR